MKSLKRLIRDESGFSLTELLVVIVIIGILASLALPKFMSVITKAKNTEAKLMLKQVYQLQDTYYLENDTYAADLQSIGFTQDLLKTDGGAARYLIEMQEVSNLGFIAKATSVVDFDKDGIFNVWTINQNGTLIEEIPD